MKAVDKWGLDKVTHFLAGALVAVMGYLVACMAGATQAASLSVGLGLSIVAGVVKELFDERFECKDLLATAIGGAAATVGLIILYVV
nr:MAG TPA: lipoprotein [Caudoviricetes sp.]